MAYSSEQEPEPLDAERPSFGEHGMMSGIRIKPSSRRDKLDPRSRIDFSRMYTVEHNVKVYDFGNVAESYMQRLLNQWFLVLVGGKTFHDYGSEYLSTIAETLKGSVNGDYDDDGSAMTDDVKSLTSSAGRRRSKKNKQKHRSSMGASDSGMSNLPTLPQGVVSSPTYYTSGYGGSPESDGWLHINGESIK